jgi:beta-aspartyl-peptidase (threonine type)
MHESRKGRHDFLRRRNPEAQLKKTILTLIATCFLLSIPATAQAANDSPKSAIEHVLFTQQDAWNHHDLDAFMTGYWNSADLTFFSGAKESKGWQATIDRYRTTYASPGHEMGKLDFSDLRVEVLGPEAAFVRGVWQLTMSDGKTPHGRFTLIFRRFPDGWKIIHDHTSAAD